MNAHAPLSRDSAKTIAAARDGARDAANAWRGHCTHLFAEAELALSQTLDALAGVPKRGAGIKAPQMIAKNVTALAQLVGPNGAFATEGAAVAKALVAFEARLPWRTRLTHGVGKLWFDENGHWLLTMRFREPGKDKTEQCHFVTRGEAQRMRDELSAEVRRLVNSLTALREAIDP